MHASAVHIIEPGFNGVGPGLFDCGSEAAGPKLGVEAFGDLLASFAGQSADLGLDLFNGAHGRNGDGMKGSGN